MPREQLYDERVSSNRTEALFVTLTLAFLSLAVWRATASGFGFLTIASLCLSAFFLFYALNYRTLVIHLTPQSLILRFGIFKWTVPLDAIETCSLDRTSLWRIGGAGIHFTSLQGRYRAMFNFLEYPRVVVALREKKGPVRDIAFSTQRPQEVMQLIQEATAPDDPALSKDGTSRPIAEV